MLRTVMTGTEHVLGLEFSGEFVTDFPFSFARSEGKNVGDCGNPMRDLLCLYGNIGRTS